MSRKRKKGRKLKMITMTERKTEMNRNRKKR